MLKFNRSHICHLQALPPTRYATIHVALSEGQAERLWQCDFIVFVL